MRIFIILFSFFTVFLNAQTDCEINTVNPDFEDPDIVQSGWPTFLDASLVPGWQTTASDNQIEVWPNSNNGGGVMAYSGDQYIELNANVFSGVYQDYATPVDGIVFTYSFAHSARNSSLSGFDVVGVYAGAPGGALIQLAQYSSEVNTGWHVYSGTYTVPTGQPITRFEFRAVSTASGNTTVGNFLDAIEFTSNFGIASDPELFLACEQNDATGILTVGIGNWSYATGLPVPIEVSPDNWEITGFITSGDYTYTWDNGFCEADLIIHYSNESINILDDHLEKQICETNAFVNLVLYEPEISTDADNFIFYEDLQNAQDGNGDFIIDPTNYNLTGNTTLYVRVEKAGHCTEIAEIQLELISSPDVAPEIILPPKCDDDFDGFVEFNLDEEAFPDIYTNPNYVITYHLSQTEALNGINPQSSIVNLISGNTAIYWARVSISGCWAVSEIHLEASEGLNGLVDQTDLDAIPVCDDDFDGIYTVNLTASEALLITNSNGINFTYYAQAQDITDDNPIAASELNSYTINGNTTIWVMIDNGECSAIRTIDFIISPDVPHTTTPLELPAGCEETVINLTTIQPEITTDNTTDFSYYLTESDAQNEINPIPDPENFSAESSGTIYVRLQKDDHCAVVLPIEYELSPLPENPLTELPTLCQGDSITLNAGNEFPDANYVWTWDGGEFTGAEFTVTEPGNYVLTITSDNNCTRSFPFEIESPAQPIISNIEFGDTYIIVEAEGSGGLIEYSLNNVIWQTSPRFDNLIKGQEYTVYVRENGCEAAMKIVTLPMIPNFISPNGDGYNDTWTIRGIDFSEQSNVKIFDRYGKIFVDSTPQNMFVWSGKYLGRPVPSGEYWYIITTIDQNDMNIKYVGHISVRNRD